MSARFWLLCLMTQPGNIVDWRVCMHNAGEPLELYDYGRTVVGRRTGRIYTEAEIGIF